MKKELRDAQVTFQVEPGDAKVQVTSSGDMQPAYLREVRQPADNPSSHRRVHE
jgi:hypothetical protein